MTQQHYEANRPLVFNHIPKTSGTAFRVAIGQAIGADRVLVGFDRSLFGTFEDFDSLAPLLRKQVFDSSADLDPSMTYISGHFAFSTTSRAYPEAQFITFLREGRARILSQWMYLRSLGDEAFAPWGAWGDILRRARGTLDLFLSDEATASRFDNVVVRNLLWPHPLILPDRFIDRKLDDDLLRAAFQRVVLHAYVDVIENPAFEENLRWWLNLPLSYERLNETVNEPARLRLPLYQELTSQALDRLEDCSRLDNAIWMHIASSSIGCDRAEKLRARTIILSVARYAHMLAS
jgi:hypothetical protein